MLDDPMASWRWPRGPGPARGLLDQAARPPGYPSRDGSARFDRWGAGAVLAMIERRAVAAGLPATTCCHTFRATGITREALGEIHGMADLFVGTIHAFCLDLLRAEAPEYLKYEVLNEVQQAHSRKSGLTACTKDLGSVAGRRAKAAPAAV